MLDVLNRYAHGFVVVPVVLASRRAKVFDALRAGHWSAAELAKELKANSGHLEVVLRLLQSLGWIERGADGRFAATRSLEKERLVAEELWTLVEADMDAYLQRGAGGFLAPWIARSRARWHVQDELLSDFFDGLLVVPVLALLTKRGVLPNLFGGNLDALPSGVRAEVVELFWIRGWLRGTEGSYALTQPGEYMVEGALNLGVAESYRRMLAAMDELLVGDARRPFEVAADGREQHVDRAMNVIASGFMHDRYFAEIEEMLLSIFSKPLAEQPKYVADTGCGDGTLLRRIYTTVRDKTPRGRHFPEHPLIMIGIDLNEASLEETGRTLADLDHLVLKGDIGDPKQVEADLIGLGVDPKAVLHVRSFLDHDRPFIPPADRAAAQARVDTGYLGVFVDPTGKAIPPQIVVQNLVEHLKRWAGVVTGHGLILLEVHCQDPVVVNAYLDQSEGLYFDAIQGFSRQLLVEGDVALMAAAEAGLFPKREYFRKFPGIFPYSRISLNLFELRPYRVRAARVSDLRALQDLEQACWPKDMTVESDELQRRIESYPLGQWVVELGDEIVGVLYSQRIADLDALRDCRWRQIADLRADNGNVIQLLGLNVRPEMQHLGLGDQLLDLILMRSALQSGVHHVAGITRCRDFSGAKLEQLADYIRQLDDCGRPVDPVLSFHHGHGAQIGAVVPEYRPEDIANLGAGIIVSYDLRASGTSLRPALMHVAAMDSQRTLDPSSRLEACLLRVLGVARQAAFDWDRPLLEMGIDSLSLLEFRTLLQQTFEVTLSPPFFFAHPTLRAIKDYLHGQDVTTREEGVAVRPLLAVDEGLPVARDRPAGGAPVQSVSRPRTDIAIIGMAGRFPGAPDLQAYWELLTSGRDAIEVVPASRWNIDDLYSANAGAPGKVISRFGGFLTAPDEFDAAFFNIPRREAEYMDPQQRLLLEVHWEALEQAGMDPGRLRDSRCGIFVGLHSHDYELLQAAAGDEDGLGPYYATGSSASIAAGRLAYFFGTRGPALALDTACSSSLVAVHLAVGTLRNCECDMAMASGVNLLLSPRLSIAFSKAGMLSPDGRCKTFDAAANGYVRSEGCGVIVLKRLDDARRDGDKVLAIIRGSAVNQDGASNGLTAPSLQAQEELLQQALRNAELQPSEIDYVEAHGTATSLGDPVEFEALRHVFGGDAARKQSLLLGSVKTNIGHAEAAAGIAGLIKVVLAMRNETLPAHLHFHEQNPHIDLASVPVHIPVRTVQWKSEDRPLRSGISSFGFSGTNAHVVVEQAPQPANTATSKAAGRPHLLALSAKTELALRALAKRYSAWLRENESCDLGAICSTANSGRAHHQLRIAVSGSTHRELADSLDSALSRIGNIEAAKRAPRVAFLFTGQGSQYAHMAHQLALTEPVFRHALTECKDILASELEQPLDDILYPTSSEHGALDETVNTQPALFAVEYALARMLQSWGITPVAVLGHSVGEYVAACVAGVFSLQHGLRLIAARGRLMQSLPRNGAMHAVLAPSRLVREALEGAGSEVSIAACNGPANTVISGRREAVDRIACQMKAVGTEIVPPQASHAFHSSLMEPIMPAFGQVARSVSYSRPTLEFVSNVTGRIATDEVACDDYWTRHIRATVRFEQGMRTLVERDIDVMLEVGPHPILSALGRACAEGSNHDVEWLYTLARGTSDWNGVLSAVARLYGLGTPINWAVLDGGQRPGRVSLPTYQWDRQHFWIKDRRERASAPGAPVQALRRPLWIPRAQLEWVPPASRATELPTCESLCASMKDRRTRLRGPSGYEALLSDLDELCGLYILSALQDLGWAPISGELFRESELVDALGIQPQYRRLLRRWFEILEQDAIIRRDARGSRVDRNAMPDRPTARLNSLMERAPAWRIELSLFKRCAENLAHVLRGDTDPLQLLFPDGSMDDAALLYQESAFARAGNGLLRVALTRILHEAPSGTVLRFLELGAGTGATTRSILPLLNAQRTEYLFTDLSHAFLDRARQAFADYPFVRYSLYDIEQSTDTQGLAEAQFDIVLASNVLHATANLREAVRNAKRLLRPGGMLVLTEGLVSARWLDLIFGLTEGWWRAQDPDLRPNHPLLSASRWHQLLTEEGFEEAAVVPTLPEDETAGYAADLYQQGVIVATRGRAERPIQHTPAKRASLPSWQWLVIHDQSGLAEAFSTVARAHGDDIRSISRSDPSLASRAALTALVSDWLSSAIGTRAAIVDFRPAEVARRTAAAQLVLDEAVHAAMSCIDFMTIAAASIREAGASFWLVTSGARPIMAYDDSPALPAAMAALSEVARAEQLRLDVRTFDWDSHSPAELQAQALYEEARRRVAEDHRIAYRAGQRYVQRLLPMAAQSEVYRCRTDGTYVVIGGLGGIGLHTARWLLQRGARRLVLVGRSVPDDISLRDLRGADAGSLNEDLAALLADFTSDIRVARADVTDESAVQHLSQALADISFTPIRGVVHAAATLVDERIDQVCAKTFREVVAAKVAGPVLLYEAFREQPLDLFLLYSSVSSLIGLPGQAAYAASNACLDGFAHQLRSKGVPATSINWCVWDDTGLARTVGGERVNEELRFLGIGSLKPAVATSLLDHIVAAGAAQIAVVPPGKRTGRIEDPLLLDLAPPRVATPDSSRAASPRTQSHVVSVRPRDLERLVRDVLGEVLTGNSVEIPTDRSFGEIGMDSLRGLEFRQLLQRRSGLPISPSLVWNHPTIDDVVEYLSKQLSKSTEEMRDADPIVDEASAGKLFESIAQLSDGEAMRRLRESR